MHWSVYYLMKELGSQQKTAKQIADGNERIPFDERVWIMASTLDTIALDMESKYKFHKFGVLRQVSCHTPTSKSVSKGLTVYLSQ